MKFNTSHTAISNKWSWDPKPVEDVRREKEKHRDSEDLEGLKDILENVILKASHFPLEFIQNAEDEESLKVGFYLYDLGLVIYNDGKPFRIENERNDIKGFCSIGVSQKYKKGIGFLGVGAKTIFTITKRPWLVSGKYNFTIEDMLYPSPHRELPPFSSDVIKRIDGFPRRGAIFYSPLLPDDKGKCGTDRIGEILNELDQSVIMFLNAIKTIEVKDSRDGKAGITFTRKDIEFYVRGDINKIGAYTCKKIQIRTESTNSHNNSETKTSEWIVGSLNVGISEDGKKNLPNSKLYDKKRASESTKVSIALPIGSEEERSYPLYCYLPLSESDTGLPFILQGDFIPTVDRKYIQMDLLWNKEILENLGILLAKIIETCTKHEKIALEFHELIPWEENISSFLEPFTDSFKSEIINMKFKFGDYSDTICLKDYIICDLATGFLASKDLRLANLNRYSLLFLVRNSILRKCLEWIGVRRLTSKEILRILLKKKENKDIDPVWIFNCYYSFATANSNQEIDNHTVELMHTNEWMLTNKRTFCVPRERLYFRMPKAKSEIQYIEDFIEVQFLHPIFTTFSGSYKYSVDRSKREAIRDFLIENFLIKILEDEGHLIRNLVVPLLESEQLSGEKRIQYFTALLFYHAKLQKKLMKDGGYRSDFERGRKRLQEICKNILVPVTTFNVETHRQSPAGLRQVEQVYLRGRKNHPSIAFNIFNNTPEVYFLSPSFYKRISDRIVFDNKGILNALEHIGIMSNLKVLENKYSGDDDTPFLVRRNLVNWKLTDYRVPGLDKLNLTALSEEPKLVYDILKDLSGKYKEEKYGRSFLEATFTSSGSYGKCDSSVCRVLNRIELRDKKGKEHHLRNFVFGAKIAALIPHHTLLVPFDTKGMGKFLNDLNMRDEPTKEELINAIEYMQKKYEGKEKDIPRSELLRLCEIYEFLSNFDFASPDIFLRSGYFHSCWFKPKECYWSDPTTQFKKCRPIIGDFYKTLGKDNPELFQKFGVNPFPSVEDVFNRFSALRKRINKVKSLPTHEEITEVRWYYKYLVGKEIPEKLKTRKIFLTDSGKMVDSSNIHTCRNMELHKVFSRRLPDKVINLSIIQEFPGELEETFSIESIESNLNMNSIPHGTENNDLTILFRLLLKMVATYEYSKVRDIHEHDIARLQELSEEIKVIDVEKIEIELNEDGSPFRILIDTLFVNDNLYLTNIRDSERVLSRIREYAINTIFKGYSNDTMNFAKELMSDGLDIDNIQESFFKQGFSRDHISQFLDEIEIIKGLQSEEQEGEPEDTSEISETEKKEGKEKEEKTRGERKAEKGADRLFPQLANPFEYEVGEIRESKISDGKGKEIGFRKKRKGKAKVPDGVPPLASVSNLGVEEIGIEFVKMACRELFGIQKENHIKDVHKDLREYDILLCFGQDRKYIEMKASLSEPVPGLTRDQFEKAKEEKENYYLFLVGNIQSNLGEVYIRYIQNPASHKHVRLGGARLKEINWVDWGNIKFGKKKKELKNK